MFTGFFKVIASKKKKKAVDAKGYVQIGDDGTFFDTLDDAYLKSPTATMCILKFLEYCTPEGLLPEYVQLWNKIRSDYIKYGYYLLNVTYTIDGIVDGVKYRNPKHFLVKDKDDNDNASTFINIKTNKVYPSFNRDPAIVVSQFPKDGGYMKYLGQIYMYNDTSMPYRITPFYSVVNWMQNEHASPTFVNKASSNAMFGNNLFIIKKSSDPSPRELEIISEVQDMLSSVKGTEEAAQNLLLEYQGDIEDVTKLISKVSVANDINMDLFNSTDAKAESRICVACYNFPKLLLFEGEGIFGDSGLAIQTATEEWAKTCVKQANKILEGFKEIGVIINKEEAKAPAVDTSIKDGQNELRSTVGGLTGTLAVQQSVAVGTTTRESAIALFMMFFGITQDEATQLLGNPEKIQDASTIDANNTRT